MPLPPSDQAPGPQDIPVVRVRSNPVAAAIGIGSNLGDRRAHIVGALAAIMAIPQTAILAVARGRETDPVGGPPDQDRFLNSVFLIQTELDPRRLLSALQTIEREFGRRREDEPRWGPRTLDLDLLVYGDLVCSEPDLVVPHPRISDRLFVLEPFAEVAPHWVVPGLNATVAELLERQIRARGAGPGEPDRTVS